METSVIETVLHINGDNTVDMTASVKTMQRALLTLVSVRVPQGGRDSTATRHVTMVTTVANVKTTVLVRMEVHVTLLMVTAHAQLDFKERVVNSPVKKEHMVSVVRATAHVKTKACVQTSMDLVFVPLSIPARFASALLKMALLGNWGICDPFSGGCVCKSGSIGRVCRRSQCPNGTYVPGCNGNCKCNNSATCYHGNGSCDCLPGWTGDNCTNTCPSGYYGNSCQSKCQICKNGTSCEPITGECSCVGEWQGKVCVTRFNSTKSQQIKSHPFVNTPLILGIFGGFLLLFLISVALGCYVYRRQKPVYKVHSTKVIFTSSNQPQAVIGRDNPLRIHEEKKDLDENAFSVPLRNFSENFCALSRESWQNGVNHATNFDNVDDVNQVHEVENSQANDDVQNSDDVFDDSEVIDDSDVIDVSDVVDEDDVIDGDDVPYVMDGIDGMDGVAGVDCVVMGTHSVNKRCPTTALDQHIYEPVFLKGQQTQSTRGSPVTVTYDNTCFDILEDESECLYDTVNGALEDTKTSSCESESLRSWKDMYENVAGDFGELTGQDDKLDDDTSDNTEA
ncbi:uncharacterized protein LOC116297680 [Actinia tenebrosa]|uniref:Uncharacterized protein LOC116297680 n=1 Tax=Actinia tenebrosa TaxID=6105 RepID=A0A6P8IAS7_ACTTE|nr:uncharacterized protein LOC116297680 [Actinia tenebrosa]